MRTLLLDACHTLGAPPPAKPLPSLGDERRSEFYNMLRMLLNQSEEACFRLVSLRQSVDFGRTGLLCQEVEIEVKPVYEEYQRSLLKMKKTQVALSKRMHWMHFMKRDGEEAQLLVEFDVQK